MQLTRRSLVQSGVAAGGFSPTPIFARGALTMPDGPLWPSVEVSNVNNLEPGTPIAFNYADPKSPAWLNSAACVGARRSGQCMILQYC